MPSPRKVPSSEAPPAKKSDDYIEIRLPRITKMRVPLLLILPLLLISYLLGVLSAPYLSFEETPITDVTSAFTYYARQLNLDEKKFADCFTTNKYEAQVQNDIEAGIDTEVTGTPTLFINGQPFVGALPYSVFQAYIDHELTGKPVSEADQVASPAAKQEVAIGHLPLLGKKDAKVTIVEFSDFQCPFCERFFTDTYAKLKKDYIETGKVSFTYRHFPLTSIHPNAKPAALASECANEQNKFWEYHDLLFKTQNQWANLPINANIQ